MKWVGVRWGDAHTYPGDLFECPKCKKRIINTGNSGSVHDPQHKITAIQID